MKVSLQELVELDLRGFVLPPDGDPDQHVAEARATLEWSRQVHAELEGEGGVEIMGGQFRADQILPQEVMAECLAAAQEAYAIRPEWVPAFYSDDYLPWYVGGASFYGFPDGVFRVCFLLRESFRERQRWLIYDRNEIAAHETCHVARAGFSQQRFEEPLAYALSGSALRRVLGGMFTGRWEAPVFLGSSLLLIAGSVIDMLGYPNWVRLLSAVPLALIGPGLAARATLAHHTLGRARRFLAKAFPQSAPAIVFRCSDEEIASCVSAASEGMSPQQWLDRRPDTVRWQVIKERFTRPPEASQG
jgi:hypothetical protein